MSQVKQKRKIESDSKESKEEKKQTLPLHNVDFKEPFVYRGQKVKKALLFCSKTKSRAARYLSNFTKCPAFKVFVDDEKTNKTQVFTVNCVEAGYAIWKWHHSSLSPDMKLLMMEDLTTASHATFGPMLDKADSTAEQRKAGAAIKHGHSKTNFKNCHATLDVDFYGKHLDKTYLEQLVRSRAEVDPVFREILIDCYRQDILLFHMSRGKDYFHNDVKTKPSDKNGLLVYPGGTHTTWVGGNMLGEICMALGAELALAADLEEKNKSAKREKLL
jgi:hypothetical protein